MLLVVGLSSIGEHELGTAQPQLGTAQPQLVLD